MPEPITPPTGETKICPSCDAVIGKSETVCPSATCGVDFEELEDNIAAVEKAQAILEKRRKANQPKPCTKCSKVHEGECPAPEKKKSGLRGLGAVLRKKGA